MSTEPLVSIVVPCKNGMPFLDETLASIANQTFLDWELVFVDDGSDDGSRGIAERFGRGREQPVVVLDGPRAGAGAARNLGMAHSRGRFIAFLDADDAWTPNKLERQLRHIDAHGAAFSCTAYSVIDREGFELRTETLGAKLGYREILEKRCVVGCSTVMFDRSRLGPRTMPTIRMRQDMALWLELARTCEAEQWGMAAVNEALTRYRVHAAGLSANKRVAAYYQWKLYRDVEGLGLLETSRLFGLYALRSMRNRLRR